jgi:hypothetical protein
MASQGGPEQLAALEPRIGFVGSPRGYRLHVIVRGKHPNDRSDMLPVLAEALGALPVVNYLAANLSVKASQGA